ncbi:hypothetical protein LTR22_018864 [Elasticomyces elasticus]|nr:hypothetical protein LTR22_018864 [Elasticomyces elasticus]KAK5753629.1 hypothetical protein LTS12_016266 [Elasticomyces elasticus]
MIDICSPLDTFRSSTNKIYVKFHGEWYGRFKSSPKQTMVLLAAKPMSMRASWREMLLAQVGDVPIRFLIPGGESPHPLIAMEKDATLGWLVDRYMADLRAIAVRSETEEIMYRRLSGTRQQHQGSAENAEQADLSRPSQLTMIFTNTSIYRTSGSHIMADNTPAEDYGEVVGPATKVFALPELLEMVLQHLHLQHPLQLFTLRRVNSTFHAVIKDSRALRDYSITRRPASDKNTISIHRRNPSLDFYLDKACYPIMWRQTRTLHHATLEPQWRGDRPYNPRTLVSRLMTEPMNAKASWRDIILSEYLLTEDDGKVGLYMYVPDVKGGPCVHKVTAEKGVTIGWFVDWFMSKLQQDVARLDVVEGVSA